MPAKAQSCWIKKLLKKNFMNKTRALSIKHQDQYFKSCVLCLISCFLLLSCNTVRHTLKEPLKDKGTDYLFNNLRKNEVQYKWLSAKFSAVMNYNDKKLSFTGVLRIRNDSAIWLSIAPVLGIEAERILITVDSVKLIDRFNKTYIKSDFDEVNSLLKSGFDFNMLESLLTGNDFTYYDIDKFKAKIDNNNYRLSTLSRQKIKRYVRNSEESMKILLQDIWVDPETFKILKTNLNEIKENRKLEVEYSDFKAVNNQIIPERIEFGLIDKNPIKITIKYQKITFDEPQTFPFRIPSGYHQLITNK